MERAQCDAWHEGGARASLAVGTGKTGLEREGHVRHGSVEEGAGPAALGAWW